MNTTLSKARRRLLPNPHPGEILAEDFLKPMKLSQTALARAIAVPPAADQRDRARQTRDYRRYSFASRAPFQYVGGIFYRLTDRLRIDAAQTCDRRQAQGNH